MKLQDQRIREVTSLKRRHLFRRQAPRLIVALVAAAVLFVVWLQNLSASPPEHVPALVQVPHAQDGRADPGQDGCVVAPSFDVDKLVTPNNPEVGSDVTISFVMSGLGPDVADVVLVHDISSSMGNDAKLDDAKIAAIDFVDHMLPADRIGVAVFSRTAALLQPLTQQKDPTRDAVEALSLGSGTNIGDGIQVGVEALTSTQIMSGPAKALILLSDGSATFPGDYSEAAAHAREQADRARDCGIVIYTIGLGEDANTGLLEEIAAKTDGQFYYAPSGEELIEIYELIAVEIRNLVITDVLPPGVDTDCQADFGEWACEEMGDEVISMTYALADLRGLSDPFTLSFTATVNLTSAFNSQFINGPDSCITFDGPGNPAPEADACLYFENPPVCIQPYKEDAYERLEPGDEQNGSVQPISSGETLTRSFSHDGDTDWVRVAYFPEKTYTFDTLPLSPDLGPRILTLYRLSETLEMISEPMENRLVFVPSPPDDDDDDDDSDIPVLPEPTVIPPVGDGDSYFPWVTFNGGGMTNSRNFAIQAPAAEDRAAFYYLSVTSKENEFGCDTLYELALTISP